MTSKDPKKSPALKSPENIVGKLAAAVASVEEIPKNGVKYKKDNKTEDYRYHTADDIFRACGDALSAFGIVLFPAMVDLDTYGDGRPYYARISWSMTFSDGRESISWPWTSIGVNYGSQDKALEAGITLGRKSFIKSVFNVAEDEADSEHISPPDPAFDQRPAHERTTRKARPKAQPKAQPKPWTPPEEVLVDARSIVEGAEIPLSTVKRLVDLAVNALKYDARNLAYNDLNQLPEALAAGHKFADGQRIKDTDKAVRFMAWLLHQQNKRKGATSGEG